MFNWIKGEIGRKNPGASPDYAISDMSGNRMTLSDVARNPSTEILVETISGVRSNPASIAPVPGMEFNFPDVPRTGTHITDILGDEIDSALVQRIVAEQGLNRGLHTLNRLLVTKNSHERVSPTTAAILQGSTVRKNPSSRTPFTHRVPEIYGAEKAMLSWLGETFGATDIRASADNVFNAKIAAKYGLNSRDIKTFTRDVLYDYLYCASANKGFIRALVRQNPSLRGNRETMQKLVTLFPSEPKAFYNGTQNVFIADPIFMYPRLAEAIMTDEMASVFVKVAENYPESLTVVRETLVRSTQGARADQTDKSRSKATGRKYNVGAFVETVNEVDFIGDLLNYRATRPQLYRDLNQANIDTTGLSAAGGAILGGALLGPVGAAAGAIAGAAGYQTAPAINALRDYYQRIGAGNAGRMNLEGDALQRFGNMGNPFGYGRNVGQGRLFRSLNRRLMKIRME